MVFNIIASGSKGNCTVICYKDTVILIDLGISFARLKDGLEELGKSFKDIDAAFFTHNHKDHIGGIKALSPKLMYALEGTLPGDLSHIMKPFKPVQIKDFKVTAFPTSHDAVNPCGFVIEDEHEKMTYMTDTGIFIEENLPLVKNPDYLVIESNHDIKMLMHTDRTMELKQRILSDVGHLNNEDSAFATLEIMGDKTKEIILAHLSEEANTPETALEAYQKVFAYKGKIFEKYHVRCANQWRSTKGGEHEN